MRDRRQNTAVDRTEARPWAAVHPPRAREATLALRTFQEHLGPVQQRPSTWRFAIVALHSALKYSLQAKLMADSPTAQLTDDVLALFRGVGEMMPELPQVTEAIQRLDHMRWRCLSKQLSLWPVERKQLPALCLDVLKVMRRLRVNQGDLLLQAVTDQLSFQK